MNGDQLQYEIDNANVPKEQRTDYPYCSFDADDWAKAFVLQNPEFDIDMARAWFANALMRGYDEHATRLLRAMLPPPVKEAVVESVVHARCEVVTIKEIQQKRGALAAEVERLIRNFEDASHCQVESFTITRHRLLSSMPGTAHVSVEVRLP